MAKRPGKKTPFNALDDLALEPRRAAERLMRDHRDAIEAMQRHVDVFQRSGALDSMVSAGRQFQEMLKAAGGITAALDASKVIGDQLSADQRMLETSSKLAAGFVIPDALEKFGRLVDASKFTSPVIDAAAITGMADVQDFIRKQSATLESISRMLSSNAIDTIAGLTSTSQLTMPVLPEIDPDFLKGWSGHAMYARMVDLVQKIADNPKAATADDVHEIFADIVAVAASAPPNKSAVFRTFLLGFVAWVAGLAVEDEVKRLFYTLFLLVQTGLSGPSPVPALTPAPPAAIAVLPASPLDWQIAGLPDIIKRAGPNAAQKTLEFFAAEIRNPNTRQAYMRAIGKFLNWCDDRDLELSTITPFAVAAYIEEIQLDYSAPSVKQHLAAIRMLFDYLVVTQVIPVNPASSVRGPTHVVKRGRTPVLTAAQARQLLDSIDTGELIGLRDRALIGVMIYSFARVSAAAGMRVADYFATGTRWWLQLQEKDGKRHEVPAHHNAATYLDEYIEAAGIAADKKGPLFRTIRGRSRTLTAQRMNRSDVLRMIYRRAAAAGLDSHACCHTFRATGITAFLESGGTIEKAQQIAGHESPRTTKLYDRTSHELTLDDIERIVI